MTILYCYVNPSSFVSKDQAIMASEHQVIPLCSGRLTKSSFFSILFRQFVALFKNIGKCDTVVVQGAGHHSLFPVMIGRLFRKRCHIIIIGMDGSRIPGIGYGNFSKQPLRFITTLSLRMAHQLIPVHDALRYSEYDYSELGAPAQGYEAFIPNLKTITTVVQNGYDAAYWHRQDVVRVKNRFLTVVSAFNGPSIIPLKGLDLIFAIAPKFPGCEFQIAGIDASHFEAEKLSSNITFLGPVPHENIRNVFSQASYYIQLSMSEGFCNSLSEAMLCECVPIGSAATSIPELIGDSGFILRHKDEALLVELIQLALQSDTEVLGMNARASIRERYPRHRRKTELLAALVG